MRSSGNEKILSIPSSRHRERLLRSAAIQPPSCERSGQLFLGLVLMLALLVTPNEVWSFSPIHHHLQIELEPSSRFARIEDTIQFKPSHKNNCESFAFYLHADLKLNRHQVPAGWQMQTSKYKSDGYPSPRCCITVCHDVPDSNQTSKISYNFSFLKKS